MGATANLPPVDPSPSRRDVTRAAAGLRTPKVRDLRLDFWRGLCLIDMVLVHLVYQRVQFGEWLGQTLGEYLRFAAGGFVLVAGLGIGYIFLPKAIDPNSRWLTYRGMWRRAFALLGVHYASTLGFLMLDLWRGYRPPSPSGLAMLRDVLLLREGGDLLPFYVVMIAASPLLLEIRRRRWGWAILAAASAMAFGWANRHPLALAISNHPSFPPLLWQAVFVTGLLTGALVKRYDAIARRWKVLLAISAAALYALLFCADYGLDLHLPHPNLGLEFRKIPLSFGEFLRYLALIFTILTATDLAWRWIAESRIVRFSAGLGRRSLAVYVAHVWLVEGVATLAAAWWWMGRWQILFAPASVGILWLFALAWDRWQKREPKREREPKRDTKARATPSRPLLAALSWRGPLGGAVLASALLFLNHRMPLPAPAPSDAGSLPAAAVPSEIASDPIRDLDGDGRIDTPDDDGQQLIDRTYAHPDIART